MKYIYTINSLHKSVHSMLQIWSTKSAVMGNFKYKFKGIYYKSVKHISTVENVLRPIW